MFVLIFGTLPASAGWYLDSLSQAVESLSGKDRVDATARLVEAYSVISLDTAKMICIANTQYAFDINYKTGQYYSRMQYANLLVEENQTSEANNIFDEVRNNFSLIEFKPGIAESYINNGIMYIKANRVKDAYRCYKNAKPVVESIKSKALHTRLKALLTMVNSSWQNAPVDIREATGAIAEAESSGDAELAIRCRILLGECYIANRQLIDGLQIFSELMNKTRILSDPIYNIQSIHKLAIIYHDMEMYDSAYYYSQICLKRAEQEGIVLMQGYAYQMMGSILGKSGNLQKRIEFLQKAILCWTHSGNKLRIGEAYSDMAEYYFENNNINLAYATANTGLPIALQSNNLKAIRQLYYILYKIFDSKGNKESAFTNLLHYREYSDTINDLEGMRQLNKFQEKISEEKQVIRLTQAKVLHQRVIIYGMAVIVGFSFVVVIIMFRNNRRDKKIYERLVVQNDILGQSLDNLRENQKRLDEMNEALQATIAEKNNHLTLEYNERVLSEILLKDSEEKYRRVVDNIHDGVFILQDDRFYYTNEAFCKLSGYSLLELIRMNLHDIVTGKDVAIAEKFLEADENSGFIYFNVVHKDGSPVNLIGRRAKRLRIEEKESMICTVTDITQFKKVQKELEDSVAEKETLVKEIHHRVKNNLQIVSSLLNMQSRTIDNPLAKTIFFEALNRIKSIALIHERLYRTENLSQIHSNDYISAIAFSTLYSFRDKAENFELDTKADDIMIEIEKAIPIALIVNEIISNAVNSYDCSEHTVRIGITFRSLGEGLCSITVTDDGYGLNDKYEQSEKSIFGFRLVKILAAQLFGDLRYYDAPGTKLEVLLRI